MALEPWQIIDVLGVFGGLLIGWRFDPWLGVAFIWAFIIAGEVLHSKRARA